jgi:protease-4
MNYQFLREILTSPWQIDPVTLNSFYPVFRGLINGLQIEKNPEPDIHLPAFHSIDRKIMFPSSADLEQDPKAHSEVQKEILIHVLPLHSLLTKHDQPCGPLGTRSLASLLLSADKNESIIGHILVIESGGGQSSAVPELTDAIKECTKPVITWIDGMAASAAYYIASYSKEIIASRASDLVGSIGTLIVWEGRKNKSAENSLGEISVTIYADGSDDKNSEYETAINAFDFTLAKERLLNPLNKKFQDDVQANRPAVLPEQLTGKIFPASEVIGSLVDSIGDFQTAIDHLILLSNFSSEKPVTQSIKSNNLKQMKQFQHLNLALNLPALESSDDGVFFNEEQLQLLEERLEANQQLVTERNQSVGQLETAQLNLETAQSNLASSLLPFNQIDPSVAAAETPDQKAEAIRVLLSNRIAATPVGTLETQDEITESEVDWDKINNSELGKLANNL